MLTGLVEAFLIPRKEYVDLHMLIFMFIKGYKHLINAILEKRNTIPKAKNERRNE
jgi:hypothetical protein